MQRSRMFPKWMNLGYWLSSTQTTARLKCTCDDTMVGMSSIGLRGIKPLAYNVFAKKMLRFNRFNIFLRYRILLLNRLPNWINLKYPSFTNPSWLMVDSMQINLTGKSPARTTKNPKPSWLRIMRGGPSNAVKLYIVKVTSRCPADRTSMSVVFGMESISSECSKI